MRQRQAGLDATALASARTGDVTKSLGKAGDGSRGASPSNAAWVLTYRAMDMSGAAYLPPEHRPSPKEGLSKPKSALGGFTKQTNVVDVDKHM